MSGVGAHRVRAGRGGAGGLWACLWQVVGGFAGGGWAKSPAVRVAGWVVAAAVAAADLRFVIVAAAKPRLAAHS